MGENQLYTPYIRYLNCLTSYDVGNNDHNKTKQSRFNLSKLKFYAYTHFLKMQIKNK